MIRVGVKPVMKGGLASYVFYIYRDRVVAAGGYVEAYNCTMAKLFNL
jgi:hypothetical protein